VADILYTWLKEHPRAGAAIGMVRSKPTITLEYPLEPRPRWGYGQPLHPKLNALINANRELYLGELFRLAACAQSLAAIPASLWRNAFIPGLDAATLYAFTALRRPACYLEVGSGVSTQFTAQAIADFSARTKIISIDPSPRANINVLCDTVIRQPLENTDLAVFSQLAAGDTIFIDNSHQSFQNSDVTVFFLEILPNLPAGILVGIHDIFLPFDYPPSYAGNYYSEQYLLAAYLLGGGKNLKIVLPNWFVSQDSELKEAAVPLVSSAQAAGADAHGGIFWLETCAQTQP